MRFKAWGSGRNMQRETHLAPTVDPKLSNLLGVVGNKRIYSPHTPHIISSLIPD